MPASSANWRIESSASSRCWRIISPSEDVSRLGIGPIYCARRARGPRLRSVVGWSAGKQIWGRQLVIARARWKGPVGASALEAPPRVLPKEGEGMSRAFPRMIGWPALLALALGGVAL